jgi:hypothetical protein
MLKKLGVVLLLCGQAQAADYVRCEAMQAAYGRLAAQQKQAGRAVYENKLDELCPYSLYTLDKTGLERLKCQNQDSSTQAAHAAREKAEAEYAAKLTQVKADYTKEGCL